MARKKKQEKVEEAPSQEDRAAFMNSAFNKGKQKKLEWVLNAATGDFSRMDIGKISSGELKLDIVLGGGWEIGRTHMLVGKNQTAKSKTIAQTGSVFSWLKKPFLMIDYEGTSGKSFFELSGADLEYIDVARPYTAEQALDLAETAILSGKYAGVAIDSIASMSPKSEQDASHEDAQMAALAKLVSKFCRKVASHQNELILTGGVPATLFLVNVPRIIMNNQWDFTMPGGERQREEASTIVFYQRRSDIKTGSSKETEEVWGYEVQVKGIKNKCGPALKTATLGVITDAFDGHVRSSFYHADSIFQLAKNLNVIEQSGAWYAIPELEIKVQGQSKINEMIMADEAVGRYLVDKIVEAVPLPLAFDYDYVIKSQCRGGEDDAIATILGESEDSKAEVSEAGEEGG